MRGGLEHRRHETFLDKAFETEDNITQAFVEASHLKRAPRYVYFASARITKGLDLLNADDKGEAIAGINENTRLLGDPRVWIGSASFFGSYLVTPRDSAQVFIRGQKSSTVLLSSDMFSIGGYNNVRGFEPAIVSGDEGATVSIEWVHNYPDYKGWNMNVDPFYDWGSVGNRVKSTELDGTLQSVGLGFDATYSYGGKYTRKIRVDWAHTVGNYQIPRIADRNTIYARFTQTF